MHHKNIESTDRSSNLFVALGAAVLHERLELLQRALVLLRLVRQVVVVVVRHRAGNSGIRGLGERGSK